MWGLTVAILGHIEEIYIFQQLQCFVVWYIYLMDKTDKLLWYLINYMWSSAGLFNIAVTKTTAATVAAHFCLWLGSWLPCFGGCRERCERQQGRSEEAGRGKWGTRVSILSLLLRSEGGKTEHLSIVEEGAVEGKGNYASFPVFCSYLKLDMNLQGEIVQSEIIVICSFCGLNFFASVPFTSASRFPLGSLHVFSVLFVACALALCSRRPLPSCHCPAHHGRADCFSQERPRCLLPSLLSPQLLPWVSCSCSLFFSPRFFFSFYGCLIFSSLSTPKLFLL